jgi:hypothetical protein
MRLVKRAAITVTPKQPYIDWANAIDEDGVTIGEDVWPERHIYLIGDVSHVIPFDRDVIVRPYFKAIFEEELNSWHRREREWPARRIYETFLAWFEGRCTRWCWISREAGSFVPQATTDRRRSRGFPPVVVMQPPRVQARRPSRPRDGRVSGGHRECAG